MLFLPKLQAKQVVDVEKSAYGKLTHFYIIQVAPNDTLNSILYNSCLKDAINMQFSLKHSQLNVV